MERKEEERRDFKSAGLREQAKHAYELMDCHNIELKDELDSHFTTLPGSLEQVLARGMYLLKERVQELKIADEYGWSGVAVFKKDELARNPEEEKKLKLLRKEKKEQVTKSAVVKKNVRSYGRFSTRYEQRGRDDWRRVENSRVERDRYVRKFVRENCKNSLGRLSGKREILAERRGRNVSTATELDTLLENVGSQGEKLVLEESRKKKSNPFYKNKSI